MKEKSLLFPSTNENQSRGLIGNVRQNKARERLRERSEKGAQKLYDQRNIVQRGWRKAFEGMGVGRIGRRKEKRTKERFQESKDRGIFCKGEEKQGANMGSKIRGSIARRKMAPEPDQKRRVVADGNRTT